MCVCVVMCVCACAWCVRVREPYFQHDTTSKWDVLTIFAVTFAISRSSDIDLGRQDGGAALEGGGVVVVF